jgi:crotonobetaine/carnitine-CoA ligase
MNPNTASDTVGAARAYPGMHDPERWVLPLVLREQARRLGDTEWLTTTVEGETATYSQMWSDVQRTASWFIANGVKRGDMVALMLPNGLDFVRAWLGLGLAGAVAVLVNTDLHGFFLEHQLRNCAARLVLTSQASLSVVLEAVTRVSSVESIAVCDATGHAHSLLDMKSWLGDFGWRACPCYSDEPPAPSDIFCVMYTSGTGGAAKGVLMPHAHCALYGIGAVEALQLRDDDRYYIALPLFHANGLLMQLAATLLAGIPAVVRKKFSPSAWLNDIQAFDVTVTNTLGALTAYILAQPAGPKDRLHRLRAVLAAPNLPEHERELRSRFAVSDVISGFGMTEVNIPVWGRVGESHPGAAGFVSRHFELVIADPQTDREVPRGTVGEILVRPRQPWGFMAGYQAMPEKTVEAWRNLWFHTGDAGTMNESGLVTFVDRIKDCIRRRGENISAADVEGVLSSIPVVKEVAAYAVPSTIAGGEDEIMLAIVLTDGAETNERELLDLIDRRLPRFAHPRYVKFVSELPKTATGKVQRNVLRQVGSGGAFDREAGKHRPGHPTVSV